jgi:protein-disulfide isomerase
LTVTTPTFDRRKTLLGAAAAASMFPLGSALAQRKAAGPDTIPLADLYKTGTLPDLFYGKADAPVTMVEYASQTCGSCGNFHNKVLPTLREKYIDTGKVRLIYREFPLDDRAMAASMLARCTGTPEKALAMAGILYASQEQWAFVRTNPVPELFKIARQAGFTQESFDKCLTDQKMLDEIAAIKDRADKQFGVNATPTFFINGKRFTGRSDQIEAFDKAIAEAMPKG